MSTFAQRQKLLQTYTKAGSHTLYRDLYRLPAGTTSLIIQSEEEWENLPHLNKQILLQYPLMTRTFLPTSQANTLYGSSGTSGGEPLFTLRKRLGHGFEFLSEHTDLSRASLVSIVENTFRFEDRLQALGKTGHVIVLDSRNPEASICLARAAKVENLIVQASLIPPVGKLLRDAGLAEGIRFIKTGGANCSHAFYEFMRAAFPNATVVASYGANEVESPMAATPPKRGERPVEALRPLPGCFIELIDPETGELLEPTPGTEGELLVTTLDEPQICPTIRYRIGDMARVVEGPDESGVWTFAVLGRANLDFVKIPGGTVRADEVERVLQAMPEKVSDFFSIHLGEDKAADMPRIKTLLYVQTRRTLDMKQLARDIESVLMVGPASTYADGVARGWYYPLECREMPPQTELKKHKRIVRDLS